MEPLHEKYRWVRWLPNPIRRQDVMVKGAELDDMKKLTTHPMSLADGDQRWGFASDGSAMILVRGAVEWRHMADPQALVVRDYLRKSVTGPRVHFGEFKKWLGQGWSATLPCSANCGGDWVKNCSACFGVGTMDKTCGHCGDGHKCKCAKCKGDGTLFCGTCMSAKLLARRPGRIGKTLVDMSLVARFVAQVDTPVTGQVRVLAEGPFSPVWIEPEEKNWRVIIMPMRDTVVPERELPRWP